MMTWTLTAPTGHAVFKVHERLALPVAVNATGVNVSLEGVPIPVSGLGLVMNPERYSMRYPKLCRPAVSLPLPGSVGALGTYVMGG